MRKLENYEELVQNACDYAGIELNEDMLTKLDVYYKLLVEWNEKINLTAITEIDEVYKKHFADSIYGAKYIKQNATLCDIGTGAGFPALVLKIVRPDLKVTLVDALEKRIKFLQIVVEQLQLQNIQTLHFRAEDKLFKDTYLNSFDIVTARAVAKMCTLCEYCLPYVKVGGKFLAYKSDKIDEELVESNKAIKMLGGNEYRVRKYNLDEQTIRYLVEIDKIKPTNVKYPRGANKPRLQPLL